MAHCSLRFALMVGVALASGPALVTQAGCATTRSAKGTSAKDRIEPVGIESFDQVFTQAANIDTTLRTSRRNLKTGRNQIAAAVGLAEGTPLQDALDELQKKAEHKVEVVMDGRTPTLKASQAVPSNVQASIDAVNAYVATLESTLAELAGVPDQCRELSSAVSAFPAQLQQDYKSLDVAPKELPGTLKQVRTNLQLTAALPDKADKVVHQAKMNLDVITGLGGGAIGTSGADDDGGTTGSATSGGSRSGSTSSGEVKVLRKKPPADEDDE